MYAVPAVRPETSRGEVAPLAVKPPGLDVAVYVIVPLPMYVDAVNTTLAAWAVLLAVLFTTAEAVGVPIVGVVGFLPPLSLGALATINYAEISPTRTHESVALLISVAYDHVVLSFKPGAAFTVTPAP